MEEMIGVIKMFAGTYAPEYFALCEGQILPIAQYNALYSVLGTTYGGDGIHTFGLPDLRSNKTNTKTWDYGEPRYIICINGIYPSRD